MKAEIWKKQIIGQKECLDRLLDEHRSKNTPKAELESERQSLWTEKESGHIAEFECFKSTYNGKLIYKIRLS